MKTALAVAAVGVALAACAGKATRDERNSMVARLFVDDMAEEHDLRPAGVGGADWGRHARRGYRQPPEGWACANMWGQIYPAEGAALPANIRIQIRNARLWLYSRRDEKWHEVQRSTAVAGAAYRQDFANDANVPADIRNEPDGSISVTMLPNHNFHFWPASNRAELDRADLVAAASSFEARLIVDDSARPADLAEARLLGSCGGDFWRSHTAQWKADWSNNGDWAIGRFKLITPEWKTFTATNADQDLILTTPPPLLLPD